MQMNPVYVVRVILIKLDILKNRMANLFFFSLISMIIIAVILSIVALSLVKASTSEFHPILIFVILLIGLIIILVSTYRIIIVGIDDYDLGSDSLFGGIFSVFGDISQDIWFNIGSASVNYSVVKGAITLTSIAGVFLGAIKFIFDKIKKK